MSYEIDPMLTIFIPRHIVEEPEGLEEAIEKGASKLANDCAVDDCMVKADFSMGGIEFEVSCTNGTDECLMVCSTPREVCNKFVTSMSIRY